MSGGSSAPRSRTSSPAIPPTPPVPGVRSSSPARSRRWLRGAWPWSAAAFETAGGLATDVGLDVAVAELCVRLAALGRSALWTPAAALRLTDTILDGRTHLIDATGTRIGPRSTPTCAVPSTGLRGLTDERYDLTGLSHLDIVDLDPYRTANMLMRSGEIDLVTSDVFDTVVTRAVSTPSDLFIELADHLDLPAHVTPAVFAEARREAERRARQQRSDATRAELLAGDPLVRDRSRSISIPTSRHRSARSTRSGR